MPKNKLNHLFEVIDIYPNSPYKVGQVVSNKEEQPRNGTNNFHFFPNIFKEIEETKEQILSKVSQALRVSEAQIKGESHKEKYVFARHLVIFLIRKRTNEKLVNIAKFLHYKDHSALVRAVRNINRDIIESKGYNERHEVLKRFFKANDYEMKPIIIQTKERL